jgi:hypothetical protein
MALKKQGKNKEADQTATALNRSLQGTDIKTEFSVY